MSARVIVTQQSRNTVAMTHTGYSTEDTGIQIVSDPGWNITAVYIVADPDSVGSSDGSGSYIHLDGE